MSKEFVLLFAGVLTGAGVYYANSGLGKPAPAACLTDCATASRYAEMLTPESVTLGEGDLLTGVPGHGTLALVEIETWLNDPRNHARLSPELPVGLAEGAADQRGLEENPLTRAKVELGRQLFFDQRLSKDETVSCASCHDPRHGYASPDRLAIGVGEAVGRRNAPTAANRVLSAEQFLDGRAASLEEQALGPIASPIEMGLPHAEVVERLQAIDGYRTQFEGVFDEGVTIENVAQAIAAFERAVVSGPSAWDHHRRLTRFEEAYDGELDLLDEEEAAEYASLQSATEESVFSDEARRGAELFFGDRAGCTQCHAGATFSDERYHNLGVGMAGVEDPSAAIDWGRYEVTGDDQHRGAFKTPTLRNVAQTGPYMHDGSLASLEEVVAWYVEGGRDNPWRSPLLEPLDLTEEEQADLVAFLDSLTGAWPEIETGRLPK